MSQPGRPLGEYRGPQHDAAPVVADRSAAAPPRVWLEAANAGDAGRAGLHGHPGPTDLRRLAEQAMPRCDALLDTSIELAAALRRFGPPDTRDPAAVRRALDLCISYCAIVGTFAGQQKAVLAQMREAGAAPDPSAQELQHVLESIVAHQALVSDRSAVYAGIPWPT